MLDALRSRGAERLRLVRFRANRRTIWSLTQGGTALNLHVGYRFASPRLLDHLALVVKHPRGGPPSAQRAREAVRRHPPLEKALREIHSRPSSRTSSRTRRRRGRVPRVTGPNCATPEQQSYLEALYGEFNRRHFHSDLPSNLPLRLSRRMRSTLGWVSLGQTGPVRLVAELALNLDLMLEANDALRHEVMLHEMAHIEAWIQYGDRGHGPPWKAVARRVGCRPRACGPGQLTYRARRRDPVHRVPPLPR